MLKEKNVASEELVIYKQLSKKVSDYKKDTIQAR